jgi:hypothetical protein
VDIIGSDAEVKYWNAVIVEGLLDHVKTIDAYEKLERDNNIFAV